MDQDPTDVSDRSESNHSDVRAFQDYEKLKELNLTVDKSKDDPFIKKDLNRSHSVRFDEFITDASELAMALNKPKDFNFLTEQIRYGITRNSSGDEISEIDNLSRKEVTNHQKDVVFNIGIRQKNNSFERNSKEIIMDREMKDFGILKNYNLERMKEFNLSFDRVRDNNLERLRGNSLMENPAILESSDYMNLQIQPRNPDLDALTYERMRRSHLLTTDLSPPSIATQRSRSVSQSQYQHHQQQQVKSFTIDAILGLRNNQREKHQKGHHPYRKHQGNYFNSFFSPKRLSIFSCLKVSRLLSKPKTNVTTLFFAYFFSF